MAENNRMPEKADLIYAALLKRRFGPWTRMLEKAGVKEVSQVYLERRRRRREKRERHKEYRRQIRAQQAAEAAQAKAAETEEAAGAAQAIETEETVKTTGLVPEPEIK